MLGLVGAALRKGDGLLGLKMRAGEGGGLVGDVLVISPIR